MIKLLCSKAASVSAPDDYEGKVFCYVMHILCGTTGDCCSRKTEMYVNNRDGDKGMERCLPEIFHS